MEPARADSNTREVERPAGVGTDVCICAEHQASNTLLNSPQPNHRLVFLLLGMDYQGTAVTSSNVAVLVVPSL